MKKFLFSVLAVGAIVACTKSEVKLDAPSEIAFAPVATTATKAAIDNNVFPRDKDFNVWAFYAKDAASANPHYPNFATEYITDATFTRRVNKLVWGGKAQSYYWPNNGSLVFAGYSVPDGSFTPSPADNEKPANPSYELSADKLTINGYTQPEPTLGYSELLWFSRTASYNNRANGADVDVTFNHALSWITLNFRGTEATANAWEILKVEFKGVVSTADVACVGKKATWTNGTNIKDILIYGTSDEVTTATNGTTLKTTSLTLENVSKGTLVIPQSAKKVEITYKFNSPAGVTIVETVTADLKAGNVDSWENGKHYIYDITFSATEILINPSVETWVEVNNIPAIPAE